MRYPCPSCGKDEETSNIQASGPSTIRASAPKKQSQIRRVVGSAIPKGIEEDQAPPIEERPIIKPKLTPVPTVERASMEEASPVETVVPTKAYEESIVEEPVEEVAKTVERTTKKGLLEKLAKSVDEEKEEIQPFKPSEVGVVEEPDDTPIAEATTFEVKEEVVEEIKLFRPAEVGAKDKYSSDDTSMEDVGIMDEPAVIPGSEIINVKIVIIGDPAVGKTTLRKSFLGKGFGDNFLMTLGVDMVQKQMQITEKITLDTQIWDIAGQDSLEAITRQFLAGTQGAIMVFDLTRDYTFTNITNWLDRLHAENLDLEQNIPFILVGNKLDLDIYRKVKYEDVIEFLEYLNRHQLYSKTEIHYLETSAKTGEQVSNSFYKLGEVILENFNQLDSES
ncbi:MAG: GTP-binding protein [Candidatus Kariarchaeaceae archaeon]|jgi:small GTP-binding protein